MFLHKGFIDQIRCCPCAQGGREQCRILQIDNVLLCWHLTSPAARPRRNVGTPRYASSMPFFLLIWKNVQKKTVGNAWYQCIRHQVQIHTWFQFRHCHIPLEASTPQQKELPKVAFFAATQSGHQCEYKTPEKNTTSNIQCVSNVQCMVEGSLEVKLPTIWTVEKQRWEESKEKRSEERRCRCAKR